MKWICGSQFIRAPNLEENMTDKSGSSEERQWVGICKSRPIESCRGGGRCRSEGRHRIEMNDGNWSEGRYK